MRAEILLHTEKEEFISFCLKHKHEVDDSFLYKKDLENFSPNEENPTYIVKEDGNIIAAVSLILDDYHRRGRNGRFRIFYSEDKEFNTYSILLKEILNSLKEIDKLFLFVPLVNAQLSENMKSLHFTIDRYVYLLLKEIRQPEKIELPVGYGIKSLQVGSEEESWCHIRNTAFSALKGNTTPITAEMVCKQINSPEYLEGAMLFLMHDNRPVGIVRGAHDDYEGEPAMNIGPLAILPAYQGKGLGKQLLRASIDFAQKRNYKKVMLCVNADNEKAKELYLKEGFLQVEGVAAYEYPVI